MNSFNMRDVAGNLIRIKYLFLTHGPAVLIDDFERFYIQDGYDRF
jgi:hypothetical protein